MIGSVNVQGASQAAVASAINAAKDALRKAGESQETGNQALGQAQELETALDNLREAINEVSRTATNALNTANGIRVTVSEEEIARMQEQLAAVQNVPNVANDAHEAAETAAGVAQAANATANEVRDIVGGMANVSRYYKFFEAGDWKKPEGAEPDYDGPLFLRVPASEHHVMKKESTIFARKRMDAVLHKIRVCKGRNCGDFVGGEDVEYAKKAIINAEIRALKANQETEGTYPVSEHGHVLLTWEQIQYFLLENVLVSEEEAAAKAVEKGFNWKDRDTIGAEEVVALNRIMGSAYVPALGGAHAQFDEVCTVEALRGLRFRRVRYNEQDGTEFPFKDSWILDCAVNCHPTEAHDHGTMPERAEGESEGGVQMKNWYELDGKYLEDTWISAGTECYIEEGTGDLVLESVSPFAGDVLVMA